MPASGLQVTKLRLGRTGDKKGWPHGGSRFSPTELGLIDDAAKAANRSRADFVRETVLTRVVAVLNLGFQVTGPDFAIIEAEPEEAA